MSRVVKKYRRYKGVGFICRVCCKHVEEPRHRSNVCVSCGLIIVQESIAQMKVGSGAIFEKWKMRLLKGLKINEINIHA